MALGKKYFGTDVIRLEKTGEQIHIDAPNDLLEALFKYWISVNDFYVMNSFMKELNIMNEFLGRKVKGVSLLIELEKEMIDPPF